MIAQKSIMLIVTLLALAMGCATAPASVHKLEDGDLKATWGGYEIDVPADAVELHGFEVTPVPSEDDHWPAPGTENYRDIPFEPVALVEGEWVDGVIESRDDIDIFVVDGGKRYEVYIYTRHAVRHEGDRILSWLNGNIVLHESRRMCHNDTRGLSVRDRDDIDGWCHWRSAGSHMFDITSGKPFYFSVRGGTVAGTYALLVVERYLPRYD